MAIEVEIRSFISAEKYNELLEFFKREGKQVKEDNQVTYYFDCEEDLRIQRNDFFSKIWMKKGKMHDEHREEIEIKFPKEDFDKLESLFLSLGYDVKIKWFRKRHAFSWEGIEVMVDYTKGYGYILELEKLSEEPDKEQTLMLLKDKLASLGVPLTPKAEFDEKFKHYQNNWQKLISE